MKTAQLDKRLPGIPLPSIGMGIGERIRKNVLLAWKNTCDFLRYVYLSIVLIMLLCALVELKHEYQIDLIPGVDTPVDNVYFAGKDASGLNNL